MCDTILPAKILAVLEGASVLENTHVFRPSAPENYKRILELDIEERRVTPREHNRRASGEVFLLVLIWSNCI